MNKLSISQLVGYASLFVAWIVTDHVPPWNTFLQEALTALAVILLWPWHKLVIWPKYLVSMIFGWLVILFFQYLSGLLSSADFFLGIGLSILLCMASTTGAQSAWAQQQNGKLNPRCDSFKHWCMILLAGALFNAVVGLAQWQGVSQGLFMAESTGRVYGNFAQPNQFATLLVMGIAVLVCLTSEQRGREGWLFVGAVVLIVPLVASESRTGVLSFNVLFLVVFLFRTREKLKNAMVWLLPSFFTFWTLKYFWLDISNYLGGAVTRSGVGFNSATRFELWQQMIEAIQMRPWAGYGWLQVGQAQNLVAAERGGTINMSYSHNILIDFLIWFGVPLGVVVIVAAMVWLAWVLKEMRQVKAVGNTSLAVLVIIPVGIHCMLEFPFAYLYFSLVVAFFAGALEVSIGKYGVVKKSWRKVLVVLASFSVFFYAAIAFEYYRIEQDFRLLRMEKDFGKSSDSDAAYHSAPVILRQYGDLVAVLRNNPTDVQRFSEENKVRRVVMRFPWLMTYQYYYIFLVAKGSCEEAANQLLVINSLFGKFGAEKIDDAAKRYDLIEKCQ